MADLPSHRRGAVSELAFIAPVRNGSFTLPGAAAGSLQVRYSDRLKRVLEAFDDREDHYEKLEIRRVPLALRAFGGIHFAHLVLIDGGSRLLFVVNFDGSIRDYLAGLANHVPALLNLVFSHCVGWEPVANRPEQLIKFVERYRVQTNFWYVHDPGLSARDVQWMAALRAALHAAPSHATSTELVANLLAQVGRASAPVSFKDQMAAMFAEAEERRPHYLEIAEAQFKALFGALFDQQDWQNAYIETFGVAP
jgi:hypothetical protein